MCEFERKPQEVVAGINNNYAREVGRGHTMRGFGLGANPWLCVRKGAPKRWSKRRSGVRRGRD